MSASVRVRLIVALVALAAAGTAVGVTLATRTDVAKQASKPPPYAADPTASLEIGRAVQEALRAWPAGTVRRLRILAERYPRSAQAQFLLGRLAIEGEQFDEAVTRLSRAVELDPDHDGAWTALGYVYEAQHKTDEAIEIYRRAVKANPDNPAFVERLGDLLIKLGRFKEAEGEVEALAELAPRDPRVWMKLGAVFYEQKQWDKAGEAFRRDDTGAGACEIMWIESVALD